MDTSAGGEGVIDQLVIVPRNGYANRLQAWASAHILARRLGAELRVSWEPEAVAATPAEALFHSDAIARTFMHPAALEQRLGRPHASIDRYLTHLADERVIVLAGHDRGEQAFMPELDAMLRTLTEPTTLIVIAGGQFAMAGGPDFRAQRADFYRALPWHPAIEERVGRELALHGRYAALHVRMTDRSTHAPTERALDRGLRILSERVPERSLFICADTDEAREHWAARARRIGFDPWAASDVEFDRGSSANGVSAMVDWLLLTHATGVVYPEASTFSTEAVVAGGTGSNAVPLHAGRATRVRRQLEAHARSAASYRSRRTS